jgi:hypothetical protein
MRLVVRSDILLRTLERKAEIYSNIQRQKNERFLLGRAIMSNVEVLNKDAVVGFVTGDRESA